MRPPPQFAAGGFSGGFSSGAGALWTSMLHLVHFSARSCILSGARLHTHRLFWRDPSCARGLRAEFGTLVFQPIRRRLELQGDSLQSPDLCVGRMRAPGRTLRWRSSGERDKNTELTSQLISFQGTARTASTKGQRDAVSLRQNPSCVRDTRSWELQSWKQFGLRLISIPNMQPQGIDNKRLQRHRCTKNDVNLSWYLKPKTSFITSF